MDFTQYPGIEAKRALLKAKLKDKAPLIGKEIWQRCRQNWEIFTPEELARINAESPDAPLLGPEGFRYSVNSYLTSEAFVVMNPHFTAVPIRDIIWIYESATKNSVNFIPTTKDYILHLIARDGSDYHLLQTSVAALSKKDPGPAALDAIRSQLNDVRPGILYGYTNEIMNLYQNDFQSLVQYVDEHSTKEA